MMRTGMVPSTGYTRALALALSLFLPVAAAQDDPQVQDDAMLEVEMPLQGDADSENQALAELDKLLGDIHTLSADVTQLILESDDSVLEESSIRMYLKKPDGFYWETLTPFPELVVTNGEKLWNYQPDLEQVVIEPWNQDRSALAAQLLSGRTDSLAEEYVVHLVPGDSDHKEFELTPLASDSLYERILISFFGPELESIHLHSKNGERTVWQFYNVMRNTPIADDLFTFEPPADIEIIENPYVD